jgi:hypothetical protein
MEFMFLNTRVAPFDLPDDGRRRDDHPTGDG